MGKPVNLVTIKSLSSRIDEMQAITEKLKQMLDIKPSNIQEIILSKYVELQSVKEVSNYMNENGYRIKSNGKTGERKYSSNDITEAINTSDNLLSVNEQLLAIAKELYKFNTGRSTWQKIYKLCKSL